jgi:hypothetical protein
MRRHPAPRPPIRRRLFVKRPLFNGCASRRAISVFQRDVVWRPDVGAALTEKKINRRRPWPDALECAAIASSSERRERPSKSTAPAATAAAASEM